MLSDLGFVAAHFGHQLVCHPRPTRGRRTDVSAVARIQISEVVSAAVRTNQPVVALESTLIAHGLPWPTNYEVACECEAVIREEGAVPATVAVWHGTPTIGLTGEQIQALATATGVFKASRRDLGVAVGLRRLAATTVSGTMAIASLAGVRVFATGGIGGAHRPPAPNWDISADLSELARTPVLVVCAGAKSILDLPRTLELLETLGVPVLGHGIDHFPEFYTAGGSLPVSARVNTPDEAAAAFAAHVLLGGGGALLANPLPDADAVPVAEFEAARTTAEMDAEQADVTGARLTPFLLKRLAELTNGQTLRANRTLIVNNARLAAQVACKLVAYTPDAPVRES
jgi:pseudouridylate synthase